MKNFFEDTQSDKEYKYKILVYPNITHQADLMKDSYTMHIHHVIKILNTIRDDVHFTILTPQHCTLLQFPNVSQVIYDMPSYPNAMRTHFNYTELFDIIDWKHNDFDILYTNLPEHTANLANLFYNTTDIQPEIIGDCHWFEIKENTSYEKTMFRANLDGMLHMRECGVNTNWLKEFILEKAKKELSMENVEKLKTIIQPHQPGMEEGIKFRDNSIKVIPKSILFNHRANEYTGWNWFIKAMDELWEERQDFHLYTTYAEVGNRPYAIRKEFPIRKQYHEFVRSMYIGVGAFDKFSSWSVSVTDGLCHGVPYLLPNKLCYPEMVGDDYPLLYNSKEEFKALLNKILDLPSLRKSTVDWLEPRIDKFLWKNSIPQWFNNWSIFDELPTVKRTESYEKIVRFIKDRGDVSKSEILDFMGWGVAIGWTNYRNLLRLEPHIKFTKTRYIYK